MKKYVKPEVEVIEFFIDDQLTDGGLFGGEGSTTEIPDGEDWV